MNCLLGTYGQRHYGPGFTARAFIARTQQRKIVHLLIQPGRPMQNGYLESFNGTSAKSACANTGSPGWQTHALKLRADGATTTKCARTAVACVCRRRNSPRCIGSETIS